MSRAIRKGDNEDSPPVMAKGDIEKLQKNGGVASKVGPLTFSIIIDPANFGPIGVHSSDGPKVQIDKPTTYGTLWRKIALNKTIVHKKVSLWYGLYRETVGFVRKMTKLSR